MRLRVGTSGFSYKEWKGGFYPKDLPDAKMLSFYASKLDAVEVNNTFYRMPKASVLEGWAKQVPEGFAFGLKAPAYLGQIPRHEQFGQAREAFFETARVLGSRLGPILVQAPPHVKRDVGMLRAFLDTLPSGVKVALELGSDEWLEDTTYELMADFDVPLVTVDDPARRIPLVRTATWGYVRLRGPTYGKRKLESWLTKMAEARWTDAWVFFKHEAVGPTLAQTTLALHGKGKP